MTGDDAVDQISRAGLLGLTRVLERRTSVEAVMPLVISLGRDDMAFFPLVYWPVTPTQPAPRQEAVDLVNYFLSHAGPILFDLRYAPRVASNLCASFPPPPSSPPLPPPLPFPPLSPFPP